VNVTTDINWSSYRHHVWLLCENLSDLVDKNTWPSRKSFLLIARSESCTILIAEYTPQGQKVTRLKGDASKKKYLKIKIKCYNWFIQIYSFADSIFLKALRKIIFLELKICK